MYLYFLVVPDEVDDFLDKLHTIYAKDSTSKDCSSSELSNNCDGYTKEDHSKHSRPSSSGYAPNKESNIVNEPQAGPSGVRLSRNKEDNCYNSRDLSENVSTENKKKLYDSVPHDGHLSLDGCSESRELNLNQSKSGEFNLNQSNNRSSQRGKCKDKSLIKSSKKRTSTHDSSLETEIIQSPQSTEPPKKRRLSLPRKAKCLKSSSEQNQNVNNSNLCEQNIPGSDQPINDLRKTTLTRSDQPIDDLRKTLTKSCQYNETEDTTNQPVISQALTSQHVENKPTSRKGKCRNTSKSSADRESETLKSDNSRPHDLSSGTRDVLPEISRVACNTDSNTSPALSNDTGTRNNTETSTTEKNPGVKLDSNTHAEKKEKATCGM